MFERQEDVVERVIRHLRRPVSIDPALDPRVMQAISAPFRRRRAGAAWHWMALAAGLGALLVVRPWQTRSPRPAAGDAFQFVFVSPHAVSVALVGDFNDWDSARTPMQAAQGVWAAVVPLPPGRYRYAFLVNGSEWRADPGAPAAIDDEFGAPSSVVTVGGGGS